MSSILISLASLLVDFSIVVTCEMALSSTVCDGVCVCGTVTGTVAAAHCSVGSQCAAAAAVCYLSLVSSPLSIIRLYGGDSGRRAVIAVIYCHSFVELTGSPAATAY